MFQSARFREFQIYFDFEHVSNGLNILFVSSSFWLLLLRSRKLKQTASF
uniref:Uncharacterized protein n=1 Tax=Arundo donax TaxID=35708 RepID=A0A0A9B6K6_ARUDO